MAWAVQTHRLFKKRVIKTKKNTIPVSGYGASSAIWGLFFLWFYTSLDYEIAHWWWYICDQILLACFKKVGQEWDKIDILQKSRFLLFLENIRFSVVGAIGLEPMTHWLRVSCSTNWARRPHKQANGVSYGIRTRVAAVRGRCPRPLDEGDPSWFVLCLKYL